MLREDLVSHLEIQPPCVIEEADSQLKYLEIHWRLLYVFRAEYVCRSIAV